MLKRINQSGSSLFISHLTLARDENVVRGNRNKVYEAKVRDMYRCVYV